MRASAPVWAVSGACFVQLSEREGLRFGPPPPNWWKRDSRFESLGPPGRSAGARGVAAGGEWREERALLRPFGGNWSCERA